MLAASTASAPPTLMPSTRSFEAAHAARRDDRHVDRLDHLPRELQVEAGARAVAVHAGQQDLARASGPPLRAPIRRRRCPSACARRGCRPATRRTAHFLASIAATMHCAPKCADASSKRSGLVTPAVLMLTLSAPGVEQRADVVHRGDAAADGQRDEHLRGHRLDHVVQQAAVLDARADVEEREFVGALLVVAARDFDRIAGVAQVRRN